MMNYKMRLLQKSKIKVYKIDGTMMSKTGYHQGRLLGGFGDHFLKENHAEIGLTKAVE